MAILHAGERAVLGGLSAAAAGGLVGFASAEVHILTPKSCDARRFSWTVVHETRFLPSADLRADLLPPRTTMARAIVDAAAWQPNGRWGCALAAAAVRQRLVLPAQLRAVALARRQFRHRGLLLAAIGDIEGGAQALSEIDFIRLCRAHRLPLPVRQARRRDHAGRVRYLDAEWVRSDGAVVVAEVDGGIHLEPATYWDDMRRQNDIALTGRTVLRFSAVAVRADAGAVAKQLRAALLEPVAPLPIALRPTVGAL